MLIVLHSRWPVIVAIIVAIVFAIFTVYCCLRCCGCCGFRRRGGRRRANTQQPSGFNPLAYQGYAPAGAPAPGYGPPEPPRYAQFDNSRKIGEDSLPAMPTWSQGQDKKILNEGGDVEMGHMDTQQHNGLVHNASTAELGHVPPSHQRGYSEVGNHGPPAPVIKHEPYTGPDFGAMDTSYGGAGAHQPSYTGPDFGHGAEKPAFTPYAPSDVSSTRYEPSHANLPQGMGSTYGNTMPPPSPNAQQTGFGAQQHAPPSVLQVGRRS